MKGGSTGNRTTISFFYFYTRNKKLKECRVYDLIVQYYIPIFLTGTFIQCCGSGNFYLDSDPIQFLSDTDSVDVPIF
jgi:hypothetical protein